MPVVSDRSIFLLGVVPAAKASPNRCRVPFRVQNMKRHLTPSADKQSNATMGSHIMVDSNAPTNVLTRIGYVKTTHRVVSKGRGN